VVSSDAALPLRDNLFDPACWIQIGYSTLLFFFKNSKMCKQCSRCLALIFSITIQLFSYSAHSQSTKSLLPEFKKFNGIPADSNQIALTNALAEGYLYNIPDSTLVFGSISLQFAKTLDIKSEQAKAYNIIAKAHYITGSFFESLSYADSAMMLSKEIGFRAGMAQSINTRGLIYLGQERMIDAIPEFKKALAINSQLKDSARIAANYFNIGLCHDNLSEFEPAFANLKKAMQIAEACKDGHLGQMSLNRIAETHYHAGQYDQALSYFNSALVFPDYQDNWEKGFAYSGLAQTLYEMKRYQEALGHAQKSFEITTQLKAKWDIERAVRILSKCHAALGDYQQAYHYHSLGSVYRDSLINEKKEKEINYLHLREKRAENLELAEENHMSKESVKNNRIITLLTAAFSLSLIVLLFLLRRNINRKIFINKKLQQSNREIQQQKEEILAQQKDLVSLNITKDRILSVISHDLRSPVASILQALELIQSGDLDAETQAYFLKDFHRQISLVSELINDLLMWANSQHTDVKARYRKVNLTETSAAVLALYTPAIQQKQQHLTHECQDPVYIEADVDRVKIILRNIISNAIKFTPNGGEIRLFYTNENGFSAIHIQDSGRGMSEKKLSEIFKKSGRTISENGTNNEPGTGLGLLLIKQFIEENMGHIEVQSQEGKGCKFTIYFKSCQNE
jgi:signal transduction histidine kinase/Tfp pilus assembly protein PilF